MIPARVSGIMQSQSQWRGRGRILVTAVDGLAARLADGSLTGHRFVLEREHPFRLVESEFAPEADGSGRAHDIGANGLRRGSSPLSPAILRQLAECAVLLEKSLDVPQEIEWAYVDEAITILQSRPLTSMATVAPLPSEVAADLRQATILLQGRGHAAQIGIASGPVVLVAPGDDPANFPVGGIAVSREASPRLSPIARKAAAVITDIGGPAGHFASICREYRTPALFGTKEATLASYGAATQRGLADLSFMPTAHQEFMASLLPYWETEHFIFAHAGIMPGLPLAAHDLPTLCEKRGEFLTSEIKVGKQVIFGHTPFATPLLTPSKIGIDTGAVYGNLLPAVELPAVRFYHA